MATKKPWKKIIAVALAVLLAFSSMPVSYTVDTYAATATRLYLKPNSNWLSASAWFAAYFFGNGDTWVKMTDADGDGYYECDVPAGYPSVIFCRMNPASTATNWDNTWDQSADLTVPTDGTNCYTVADGAWSKGSGTWSTKIFGYYVAGSSGLCGENWNTTADPMTANSNGTYSITFYNVAAGTHSFKVVANGDYSAGSWPSSNYSLNVTTASDVTITFTPSTKNISVTQTPLVCTHSYTSSVTKAATCTTAGTRKYTCSKCSYSYTESIAELGHDYSSKVTAPTCTANGYTTYTCSRCSDSYTDNTTSATGHSYSSTVTKAATCTATGTRKYTCSKCSDSYTETIAKLGHNYSSTVTAPTCTAQGYTTHTCSRCSDSYQDTYTDATGHSYVGATCSACGATRSYYLFGFINGANYACEEDAANIGSYKFVNNTLTVTFTSDSYVAVKTGDNLSWYMTDGYPGDGVASATLYNTDKGINADKLYVPGGTEVKFTLTVNTDETLKLSYVITSCSHNYSSEVTEEPTCTATGTKKYTCSICGDSYTESVAAVGHKYTDNVTAPTCTAQGYTTHTCSVCGDSYKDSYKDATGHSYVGATCTGCGLKRDYYLFGYINGANYACEEDAANIGSYKFVNNTLTVTFTSDSYVAVKTGDNLSWYMTNGYPGDGVTSATLYNTEKGINADKLYVPGGTEVTFTLVVNDNDTLVLSYAVDACQHLTHSTSGVCTACGETVDHSWSSGECSVCGKTCAHSSHNTSGECTTCGSTVSHSYTSKETTAATCTTDGVLTYTCSVCAHSYTETISALGHEMVNGTCSVCGYSTITTYNVTFNGTDVTSNGASTANDAENYTATLTPASGYHLPASITVMSGNTTLTSVTHYSYNSSTGALTINASAISGDITITAEAEQDYYIVAGTQSLTGSNWDITDTDNQMTQNADGTYSITYNNVAAGDYEVKAVKNGSYDIGQWPQSGNKSFTVDETSKVTVTLNLTTNELTVDVISLVSHYEVTFNGTNVTSNGSTAADDEHNYTATLTAAAGYKLPSAITVKVGDSTLSSGDYTYNSSTGALTIPASSITGDITITAVAEDSVYMVVGTQSLTGSDWNASDTDNLMTKNADGTYTIVYSAVPAGTHEFKITENGEWKWPANNYELNTGSTSKVTITYNPTTGEGDVMVESVYVRTDEIDLPANQVYYATVDLVDYLNNNRVENDQVKGYFIDNQGEWIGEEAAVFSYMNHLVSQQDNYTYPLYFGPLHYIKSRYSKEVGSTASQNLSNWSTAANVAFGIENEGEDINGSGVAQGLVGNKLDANGNLVDPLTNTPLLYFDQAAAERLTNNGHKVMAYYPNLQFPFVMSYDAENRFTTYSYDSAKDYAVYYDYTNSQLYASNTYVKDYMGNKGFYPLNAPTDADNQVNNGFGAKFTIDFTVGDDGYLANGEPVTFEFTGDDDVWVFIDGVLVLDMGGAHAMANGKINFATQEATVSNAASVGNSYKITSGTTYEKATYSGQNLENYIYDGYNDGIDVMERATPDTADVSATFESLGLNFDYGSVHTMTVFYMERGMFESNFSMEFTMIPVPSGLTLSKNLNDSEINKGLLNTISRADDLSFTLEATSPDANTSVAFSKYTLLDKYTGYSSVKNVAGTTSGRTYTAAIDGVNNYVYANSFVTSNGEDAFIPGTSFTITETTKGIFTYTDTTWVIYDANNGYINITDSVKTSTDDTPSNVAEFTMGTAGSATAYSYAVSFINKLALGDLQVVKNVSNDSLKGVAFTFKVYIDLDGSRDNFRSSLYPGLVYTVGGTTYTSTDGTIIVPGGKTAVISGLPAGATFVVEEVVPSGVNWILSSSSGTNGTITANGTETASFTNAMEVGTLQISKVFDSNWLSDTKFTFTVYINNSLYSGTYTVGGSSYSTTNGTITLGGGQTAVISDLPAGATYTVSETVPTNAAWELSSSTGTTGTITTNSTMTASFTNTLKTGDLQISKVFNDTVLEDARFTFTVDVDADGSGTAYSSSLYTGSYTIGGTTYTANNGTITLSGGQTAVISGLPAGATYQVAEVIPEDAPWHQESRSGDSGSITANGTASAGFTNAVNVIVENKTIYVEAGKAKATDYTIKYNDQIVYITDLTPGDGITATVNGDHIQVTGQDPDKQYTLTYEGRLENGTIIGGSITVYTFQAMNKVYVFDFGLPSNLADTAYDDGLFQQDHLFNQYATGESAALYTIIGNEDNTQTSITYTQGAEILASGASSAVTFRPTAFMSKVETYSYTVHITAFGETFDANDPETGCAVTGTIEVMPANSVYYEDNFNIGGSDASEKFIYSNSKNAPTTAPTVSQSNDQSSNYGHDDAYLGDYADSNDSATVLDHTEYTYFTFIGTGFDLDSRTTASTAGMAVYVFKDTHRQEYLDYVTDLEYEGTLPSQPSDMVFVNNYYANGDLYQVPVVSVRLDEYATYTVYIQCLSTSYATSVVIDGVRIYDPLKDTSKYLLDNEKNTSREELRVMYGDDRVSHAIKNGATVAKGLGKGSIVERITGGIYTTAQELMDIYKSGPNNEMYLPANCGIGFSYTVADADWTLQLGAKAVTASNDPKTISVWVRSGNDSYTKVDTIELKTTTDMYYDLTGALADHCEIGTTYDIIIISEEVEDINNEFVSLTTVKYAGVTLG